MYIASFFLMMQGLKEYREAMTKKIKVVDKKVLDSIVVLLFIANIFSSRVGLKSYGLFFVYLVLVFLIDILTSIKARVALKKRLGFWLGVFYILIGFETIVWIRNVMPNNYS